MPKTKRNTHQSNGQTEPTALHPVEPSAEQTALVKPVEDTEAREATLVLKAREEMRSDMAARLAAMMANLRSGLQVELIEFHSALRDATLQSIATRLEAINLQLEKPVSPLLKPSIRATVREIAGVLSGVFLQMLQAADPEADVERLTTEARAMAEAAVYELVPNSASQA